MSDGRKARDLELLDAIDRLERRPFEGAAWRVVREGRDVLQGAAVGARWDPGLFDVLYTSLDRDGALAEIHFHLSRQPVFPSKIRWQICRLTARTRGSLHLLDMADLERLGVDRRHYRELTYADTQAIGDAAHFLGFDVLIVPSARWECLNLVLFTDRLEPADLSVEQSEWIDWAKWVKSLPRNRVMDR